MNLRTIGRGLVALARKLMFWRRQGLAVINRDIDRQNLLKALAAKHEKWVGRRP